MYHYKSSSLAKLIEAIVNDDTLNFKLRVKLLSSTFNFPLLHGQDHQIVNTISLWSFMDVIRLQHQLHSSCALEISTVHNNKSLDRCHIWEKDNKIKLTFNKDKLRQELKQIV